MSRLGRGLDALFQENLSFDETVQEGEQIVNLEIEGLKENPYQPRQVFDQEKIDELALSIKEHGVFQPIIVKKGELGFYIVAGERRFRACKQLGFDTIPAIVRDIDDKTMAEIALLENLQRENLNPIEEALAYKMLLEKYNLTQQLVAERVGKSRAHVTNMLRMLNLPSTVQFMLQEGKIELGHAKVLAGLENEDEKIAYANQIHHEKLSVRALEVLIKEGKPADSKANKKAKKQDKKDVHIIDIENKLVSKFGTHVKINLKGKGGKIVVDFNNTDDLNRILETFDLLDQ